MSAALSCSHNQPTATDAELVTATRAGSRTAFNHLVERYQALVCSLAYALTGSLSHSEEIAQETFVTAWRRLSELREADAFRGWLCGITKNMTRRCWREEQGRRRARSGLLPGVSQDLALTEPSPLERLVADEEQTALWRALGRIPEAYRLALVLFYREEKSVSRVAEILQVGVETARWRLWRGRQLMQEEMVERLESASIRARPGRRLAASVALAIGGTSWRPPAPAYAAAAWILPALIMMMTLPGAPKPMGADLGHRASRAAVPVTIAWQPRLTGGTPAAPADHAARPGLTYGQITADCPAGGPQSSCLAGSLYLGDNTVYSAIGALRLDTAGTVIHSDDLTFAFDAWIGAEWGDVTIQIWNKTQRANYYGDVYNIAGGAWAHFEIRTSAFYKATDPARRLVPGDVLSSLHVFGVVPPHAPFYVANLTVGGLPIR